MFRKVLVSDAQELPEDVLRLRKARVGGDVPREARGTSPASLFGDMLNTTAVKRIFLPCSFWQEKGM